MIEIGHIIWRGIAPILGLTDFPIVPKEFRIPIEGVKPVVSWDLQLALFPWGHKARPWLINEAMGRWFPQIF